MSVFWVLCVPQNIIYFISFRYSTRLSVQEANSLRLEELPGESLEYMARDGGSLPPSSERDTLEQGLMAPHCLSLKVGALVMLIKNISDIADLANGSLGSVVSFCQTDNMSLGEGATFSHRTSRPSGLWPLVRFQSVSGASHYILMLPEMFTVESMTGEALVSRKQVRLSAGNIMASSASN